MMETELLKSCLPFLPNSLETVRGVRIPSPPERLHATSAMLWCMPTN
jgi:hypothetical protein